MPATYVVAVVWITWFIIKSLLRPQAIPVPLVIHVFHKDVFQIERHGPIVPQYALIPHFDSEVSGFNEHLVESWLEVSMTTIEICVEAHTQYKMDGASIWNTDDPTILAGAYLKYADNDLERAISTVESHRSGKYLDRPDFYGSKATLELLCSLRTQELYKPKTD